jgi:hypothetical protein
MKNASPNLVQQDFSAARPNQLWTSDMTYIWTREGWLYLAIILDVFARWSRPHCNRHSCIVSHPPTSCCIRIAAVSMRVRKYAR